MKNLIAVMQKKEVTREEMVNHLEKILLPLAHIVNDEMPIYYGFPIESILLKGNDKQFLIGFEGDTLAYIDLSRSCFSVFGYPEQDLTAEENMVISHLWEELQKKKGQNNNLENMLKLIDLFKGNN